MKEFLSKNGIAYIERDIENDPGALDELRSLGFQSLPVTVISGKAVPGFNPKQLTELLQLDGKTARRDPSETIPFLERALEAVEQTVRQMPADKLNWSAPGRARPLTEIAYHIFIRVQRSMQEITTDVATPISPGAGRFYTNFQDIADFGKTVIEQYRAWVSQADAEAPKDESYTTRRTERLDNLAAHTTQHLRQLYFVLESSGITPENKLEDAELPPEYVLSILW